LFYVANITDLIFAEYANRRSSPVIIIIFYALRWKNQQWTQ